MLKIGDFSKLSRISIRMLRHYDEIGLLVPASIDDCTGYRYYSENQLPKASRIASLKNMGFSLSVISEMLKNYHDPQALSLYLTTRRAELAEQEAETRMRIRLLETAINQLRKDGTSMKYDVAIKEMPERYVASLRKIIPSYDQEGILWAQLHEETAPLNMQIAEPCYGLAVFHDEGYKENDADVEIQLSVRGQYKNTASVVFRTIPSVQIASATYQGSYEKLTDVNMSIAHWLKENGYELDGHAFSIYHVSPAMTDNPEELVTEVCYPIRKK